MAGIRLSEVHVERELFTNRDYNLKRQMIDAARRRTSAPRVIKALSGVSLEIPEGARLGLVGANGAGKSTLLAVVAGLLPPTRGKVEVDGRVLALLGGASAGLDLEASGRDNIVTMGLQLGETPAAMRARIDEVTEFSGLQKRIDHAVHTYSSGMQARLRFSILTSLRPDVLVIDEGIGMADAEFSERAGARLTEFLSLAGILVMASHSEALISQYCHSAVWLDQGVIRDTGTVDAVLAGYRAMYHHEPQPQPEPEPEPELAPEPVPEPQTVAVQPIEPTLTPADAEASEEMPPDWYAQIVAYSHYQGRLHASGRVVSTAPVDRILIGSPPWTNLVELPVVRASDLELQFDGEAPLAQDEVANAALIVQTADRAVFRIGALAARALAADPVVALFARFQGVVRDMERPRVLDVGAGARPGTVNGWLPDGCTYVKFGDAAGPDVDVVGEAHTMSEVLPRRYFDAACSLSTFQQLAMPWVAVVELNRVLKVGAYVYAAAPQTWPDTDGDDFFRFSKAAWATLFNEHSGFVICDVASGAGARVVANVTHAGTLGLEAIPAFLNSAVLARKVSETDLRWDAPVADRPPHPSQELPVVSGDERPHDE